MADVFISYSRLDKEFVGQLRELLIAKGQEVWIDWESIPPSQAWWNEIQKGIVKANNFVVVMSPNSMASPICQMEIEYARQLKKRIIPVFHAEFEREECLISITKRLAKKDEATTREIWGTRQPHDLFDSNDTELKHINYFIFKGDADFQTRFNDLFEVIRTDYQHKELHTTLQLRAEEWNRRNRDSSFLLNGNELDSAEHWLVSYDTNAKIRQNESEKPKLPEPTEIQRIYITSSRAEEDFRAHRLAQLDMRRRQSEAAAKIARQFLIGVAVISGLIIMAVAALTSHQIGEAETKVGKSNITLTAVAHEIVVGQNYVESLRLAAFANSIFQNNGNAETAALLSIRALSAAYSSQADTALVNALDQLYTRKIFAVSTREVKSVALSPDGQLVLTGSLDGKITLLIKNTGKSSGNGLSKNLLQ